MHVCLPACCWAFSRGVFRPFLIVLLFSFLLFCFWWIAIEISARVNLMVLVALYIYLMCDCECVSCPNEGAKFDTIRYQSFNLREQVIWIKCHSTHGKFVQLLLLLLLARFCTTFFFFKIVYISFDFFDFVELVCDANEMYSDFLTEIAKHRDYHWTRWKACVSRSLAVCRKMKIKMEKYKTK